MLNTIYYIRPFSTLPPPPAAADIIVAHLIDARENQHPLLAHQYSPCGNYPFCLALRNAALATPEMLKGLLLLFFHPCYAGAAGTLLIDSDAETLRVRLREVFGPQRIDLDPVPIDSLRELGIGSYYRYCVNEYNPADRFLLQAEDDPAAIRLIEDLHSALANLRAHHPRLLHLALQHCEARRQLDRLTHERTCLAEERTILQQLLELSNKHDEVNYILHFYKNEYEILPLWYKRFGHILKVIAGKRSFRSLYDKTAKKYKD